MAGAGRKIWTRERLTVADVQNYLMDQVVMRFASAAARGTAISAPSNRMVTALDSYGLAPVLEMWTGAAHRKVAEPPAFNRWLPSIDTSAMTVNTKRGLFPSATITDPFGVGVPFFGLILTRADVRVVAASTAALGAVGDPDTVPGTRHENRGSAEATKPLTAVDLFTSGSGSTYTFQPILKAEVGTITPINDQRLTHAITCVFRGV